MKKIERRDDYKLHSYIDFCWSLTVTKKLTNNTSRFVATLRVLLLSEKILSLFLRENQILFKS